MPFYTGGPEQYPAIQQGGIENLHSTLGENLGAAFDQGLSETPTSRITSAITRNAVSDMGQTLSPEEANQRFGIKGDLSFDKPVSDTVASELNAERRARILRQQTITSGPSGMLSGLADFTAGQIPQFLDPINVAASFVPGLGSASISARIGEAAGLAADAGLDGLSSMAAKVASANADLGAQLGQTRAGGALMGASQGAAGQAMLEPMNYALDNGEHEDWSMSHALLDLAFGSALGSLHGAALGGHDLPADAPARQAAEMDVNGRGAGLNEALSAASEGRPTVAGEMISATHPDATDADRENFTTAAQSSVMTPPPAEAQAQRETQARTDNASVYANDDGSVEAAMRIRDRTNTDLGIGTEHSALPPEADGDLEKIHAMRDEGEGMANAYEAAAACLARGL